MSYSARTSSRFRPPDRLTARAEFYERVEDVRISSIELSSTVDAAVAKLPRTVATSSSDR